MIRLLRYPKTLALIAGAASATGFAPLGLWPVTVAATALLMALVAAAPTRRRSFALGWWWGLGQFAVGLNWIAHAFTFQYFMPPQTGYVAVLLLSLYLALYPALATLLSWGLRPHPARFALAFGSAWIVSEWLRATLFTGFAWNPLGSVLLDTVAVHVATLVGTYGLGAVVVLFASLVWFGLARERRAATITGVLSAVVLMVGTALVDRMPGPGGVPIRVVQPNVSQAERHDRGMDEISVRRLEALTGPKTATPRLILWPEAAVPYYLDEERWARYRLARLLGPRDVLVTGGTTLIYDSNDRLSAARNSLSVLTAPDGDVVARYDKAHLVPWGEYLPLRPILSRVGLDSVVQSAVDFVPGPGAASLDLPGFGRVGMQICYEIIFSGHVVDRDRRPSFIFNASTDAWFGAWGPPQHLNQARLRGIEEGLPVVRATPTGISAVTDADGRVRSQLPMNKAGFLDTRVPSAKPATWFARAGNTIPLGLALALALAAVAPWRRLR